MEMKCAICQKTFPKPSNCSKKEWKKRLFCSRKCKGIHHSRTYRGKNNKRFKGGTVTVQGYRSISLGRGKHILEHRLVMQRFLKRKLKRNEIVHHIDGDKLNNDINNLRLYSSLSAHCKEHYPKGSRFGINSR
jgi:HNH endonuclease